MQSCVHFTRQSNFPINHSSYSSLIIKYSVMQYPHFLPKPGDSMAIKHFFNMPVSNNLALEITFSLSYKYSLYFFRQNEQTLKETNSKI